MIVVVALKLFVYSIRVVLHFIGIYESCIYSVNDLLVSHYIPIFQGFCSRGQLRVAGVGEFRSVNENNKSLVIYLLGGLLLLLLLLGTIIGGLLCRCFCGCFFSWWGCFFLLLLTATGNKESNHILGSDETIIVDLEFAEDIIDLSLVDRQVSLHLEHWCTRCLLLLEHVTALAIENGVDTAHGLLGALHLDEVDGLQQTWLSGHAASVQDATGSWDQLSTATMDGIGVEGDIVEIETDSTHVLVAEDTFLGGPVETGLDGVLDLVKELDSLGDVNDHVGSVLVGSEGPDLTGVVDVPLVLLRQVATTGLWLVTWRDILVLDLVSKTFWEGLGLHVQTVVLVGRLGQAHDGRLLGDGLAVRHNGVGLDDGDTGVVLLQILQADLQVQLTGTGDNVLARLLGEDLDHGVGLGQTLEAFDQLGEIGWVLAADGDADNGRDGELHLSHVVGLVVGGDATGLDQVLVNADKTDQVTGGDVIDGFDVAAHHKNGTLDLLVVQITLLAGLVVGAHNADLLASGDFTSEDATESVEAALVGGGDHLGDVGHQGSVGVAVLESEGNGIVMGTLVQLLHAVSLGGQWGWQVNGNYLQQSLASWQPVAHEALEHGLALEVLVVTLEGNTADLHDLGDLLVALLHDVLEGLVDWVQNPLDETALGCSVGRRLHPLLVLGVEEVVTPQMLHHLVQVDLELGGVHLGELLEGEGPAVETGAETDGSVLG